VIIWGPKVAKFAPFQAKQALDSKYKALCLLEFKNISEMPPNTNTRIYHLNKKNKKSGNIFKIC